eukprot:3230608-Rhodomonas_salina.1
MAGVLPQRQHQNLSMPSITMFEPESHHALTSGSHLCISSSLLTCADILKRSPMFPYSRTCVRPFAVRRKWGFQPSFCAPSSPR